MVTVKTKKLLNEVKCPHCKSELTYEDTDVVNLYTGYGIVCPVCDDEIIIQEFANFTFPDSFYQFGNGVKLTDSEIQRYIDENVDYLRNTENEFDFSLTGSGDSIVIGTKTEEGITIYVAKNYYEAEECK